MLTTKTFTLAALCAAFAAPVLADAAMVDYKANLHDADYEAEIAEYGYTVGAAVYGKSDADYDVYLTDAALFPPLLGQYDADYEAKLDHGAFANMEIAAR